MVSSILSYQLLVNHLQAGHREIRALLDDPYFRQFVNAGAQNVVCEEDAAALQRMEQHASTSRALLPATRQVYHDRRMEISRKYEATKAAFETWMGR